MTVNHSMKILLKNCELFFLYLFCKSTEKALLKLAKASFDRLLKSMFALYFNFESFIALRFAKNKAAKKPKTRQSF